MIESNKIVPYIRRITRVKRLKLKVLKFFLFFLTKTLTSQLTHVQVTSKSMSLRIGQIFKWKAITKQLIEQHEAS